MLLKLVGVMPSWIFAADGDNLWLNLYIDGEASFGDTKIRLADRKLTVDTPEPKTVRIRIPEWAHDFALTADCTEENGYAVVKIKAGVTEIGISYTEKIAKIMAHPWVSADTGRIAFKRGPVLYCCEKQVEKWEDLDPILADDAPVLREDGMIELTAENGEKFELIEYRRWNNRGPLPMRIWFRQKGHRADKCDLTGWEGRLYREYCVFD